jgi:alkanesulfonate monooxygenase SsuD/methylene tetrahydromethanopterin reductase-like flavin-dependent oxidoreductase (luciferase family)
MALLALRYDLRHPDFVEHSVADSYAAFLDQVRWGDRLGLDLVILSEHHGASDGFMSAPLSLAAAVAGATQRIGINVSALLLSLHDPIRVAEQLVAIDLLSRGRVSYILGTGYRDEEFAMAGTTFADRLSRLEAGVRALRAAFTGEPFEYEGRSIVVTPKPHSPGGPLLMLGGTSRAAVRRAARLRMPFSPASGDPEIAAWYAEECAAEGYTEGFCILPKRLGFVHVSEDPERDWARIAPYALHEAQTYGSWQRPGQHSAVSLKHAGTIEEVRDSGVYRVLTPEETIALASDVGDFGTVILHPLMGGMPPELGWEGLHLFEQKVLPALRPTT